MILPLVLAMLAATLNAVGDLLQRRSMRTEPGPRGGPLRLVVQLLGRPGWLAGLGASVLGLAVHIGALSIGRIVAVQPVLVMEFPLAVLGTSLLFGVRLVRRDQVAIVLMTVGLAAVLFCLAPKHGDPTTVPGTTWAVGLGALVVLMGGPAAAGASARGNRRAALLGLASGVGYGATATLLAAAGATTHHGLAAPLGTWQTYAALAVGTAAFALLQSSMNAGLLLATEPGLTLANPLVAIAWGVLVFDERIRTGPWLVGAVLGALLLAIGTVVLSRSPVLEVNRRPERAAQPSDAIAPA
ncbi:DMT family transporter [Actinomycetospora rhizophila]|uniref:DMT family transporter n=1 Tax=Actinomycetospora rhizophila TaxID=1416876 RepID=A0ABV9Z9K8_9PSEU